MQLNENTKWCAGALLRGATPSVLIKKVFYIISASSRHVTLPLIILF